MVHNDTKKDILGKGRRHLKMMVFYPLETMHLEKKKKWGRAPFGLLPTHADDCTQNDNNAYSNSNQKYVLLYPAYDV